MTAWTWLAYIETMNTAVRDLEQIEERDPTEHEAHFRRAAAFVLAATRAFVVSV